MTSGLFKPVQQLFNPVQKSFNPQDHLAMPAPLADTPSPPPPPHWPCSASNGSAWETRGTT